MRRTVRALVLTATVALLIVGGVHTAVLLRNQHLRKQPATEACIAGVRSSIAIEVPDRTQVAAATVTQMSGRTTGLAEDDGDRALRDSSRTRADILVVWEFSGLVDIPGRLPAGIANRSEFSCNAIVFTDHSVTTYGVQVTEWQPGDVVR